MSLLLYSFSNALPKSFQLKGVNGKPLRFVESEEITVSYSELAIEDLSLSIDFASKRDVQNHPAVVFEKVNREIHQATASIPLRLPTFVSDKNAILSMVGKNAINISQEINAIGDLIEHTLVFQPDFSSKSPAKSKKLNAPTPGTQYLKKKLDRLGAKFHNEVKSDSILKNTLTVFKSYILNNKMEQSDLIKIHLLSPRHWSPSIEELDGLKEMLQDVKIYYLGAFPPFHFTNLKLNSH